TLVQYFFSYLSEYLGQQVVQDLRIKIYSHLVRHNITFYNKNPIGKLLTYCITDTSKLLNVLGQDLFPVLVDLLQIAAMAGLMFYMNWKLSMVSLTAVMLLVGSVLLFKKKVKTAYR